MAITQKSTKILWAAAAGRCSFPECWEKLCASNAGAAAPFTLGEMAHICGDRPGSNRHNPSQSEVDRDDYRNLVLMCPTHHRLIDRKENENLYTVDALQEMKFSHERKVLLRLDVDIRPSVEEVACDVLVLLAENREAWARYGPGSEVARKEPHNESVRAVWISERLSTIVPNNRKILEALVPNRNLFALANQQAISAFLIHARSYESWVRDEIPYRAVVRFPSEFEAVMKDVINVRVQ